LFGAKFKFKEMTIAAFDHLDIKQKKELLYNCCASDAWVKEMLTVFPVNDLVDLLEYAEEKWYECNAAEWLEVFHRHKKIYEPGNSIDNANSGEVNFLNFSKEQFEELVKDCEKYAEIYGFNFIILTKDKTAEEIIEVLKKRLENDPNDELTIAAAEQSRINQSCLQKLFV